MAKIVSLVVFVLALSWTWFQFKRVDPVSVDVHAAVQSKLQLLIEETIKSKIPTMQGFRFLKMYTEKIDETQLKASFSYEYEDTTDQTKQKVTGEAYLNRALSEDPAVKKWVLQRVITGQETIEFAEGLLISPDAEGAPTNAEPSTGTNTEAGATSTTESSSATPSATPSANPTNAAPEANK